MQSRHLPLPEYLGSQLQSRLNEMERGCSEVLADCRMCLWSLVQSKSFLLITVCVAGTGLP